MVASNPEDNLLFLSAHIKRVMMWFFKNHWCRSILYIAVLGGELSSPFVSNYVSFEVVAKVKEDDFLYWNRRETPKAGDLILTREAPMGNVCIIPEGVKTCFTQRLILLRCDEEFINPRYLLYYLNSVHFKKQALDMCRGLTTPHIRVKDMPKL